MSLFLVALNGGLFDLTHILSENRALNFADVRLLHGPESHKSKGSDKTLVLPPFGQGSVSNTGE